jgi:hypothetical protein
MAEISYTASQPASAEVAASPSHAWVREVSSGGGLEVMRPSGCRGQRSTGLCSRWGGMSIEVRTLSGLYQPTQEVQRTRPLRGRACEPVDEFGLGGAAQRLGECLRRVCNGSDGSGNAATVADRGVLAHLWSE